MENEYPFSLDRRSGERRRVRVEAALEQLEFERRSHERRVATEERIATARLVHWKARFDAARFGGK